MRGNQLQRLFCPCGARRLVEFLQPGGQRLQLGGTGFSLAQRVTRVWSGRVEADAVANALLCVEHGDDTGAILVAGGACLRLGHILRLDRLYRIDADHAELRPHCAARLDGRLLPAPEGKPALAGKDRFEIGLPEQHGRDTAAAAARRQRGCARTMRLRAARPTKVYGPHETPDFPP